MHLQAKRVLSDTNFMRSLEEFDKDNIPDAVIHKLKKYIDDPQYQPDVVAKQSRAAMSLCMWTRAMDVYNRWVVASGSSVGPCLWPVVAAGLPWLCQALGHIFSQSHSSTYELTSCSARDSQLLAALPCCLQGFHGGGAQTQEAGRG